MVVGVSDDLIVPVPLLDRDRVAEAIRRRVSLDLDPVYAKAAARGMPVELTEEQSLKVADVALAALVAAHPIDGRTWLAEANKDWQARATAAGRRCRVLVASARRELGFWRGLAITAWLYFANLTGQVELHWPRWSILGVVPALLGVQRLAAWWSRKRARRAEAAL